MEQTLYVNGNDRAVYLELGVTPSSNQIDVSVYRDGTLVYEPSMVSFQNNMYQFNMPLDLVQYGGQLTVEWQFDYTENGDEMTYTNTTAVNVVRPILPFSEMRKIMDDADQDELESVEQAVRTIIESYCHQKFGYDHKTVAVEGRGYDSVRLPERLVEIEGLSTASAILNVHTTLITSDGWYLKKGWSDEVTAIPNDNLYFGEENIEADVLPGEPGYEKPSHGYIINAPGRTGLATPWKADYPFKITGWWGYKSVPTAVTQAAKLLVNDYACQEIAYRDRYLSAIKAADWRFDFSELAWVGTGNVRADQLLSEYVIQDWGLI